MRAGTEPIFWPGSQYDREFKDRLNSYYNDSLHILQDQWLQADIDQKFSIGDNSMNSQIYSDPLLRRKLFSFPIIPSIVQAVSGYQRQTRKSTIAIPTLSPVQKTADQLTKCLYYVHTKDRVYQTISDIFEQGSLAQGAGFAYIYPDYSSDPISPDICVRNIDFKSLLIDPFFRKKDLSDCRFIWQRQYLSREEAILMYSDFRDQIYDVPFGGFQDDKFYYMPENFQVNFNELLAFDEVWYLTNREVYYVIDTLTQETKELLGDEEDIRYVLTMLKDKVRVEKKNKQTVSRCIMVNGRVMVDEKRPYGIDRYSHVFYPGYFSPNATNYSYKFRGITRDIRYSQYLFDRRKIADLDILESQQQGLKAKKGALLKPDDSLNAGNGRVLIINDKMQMSDVEQMQIIPPSQVMLQMEEMLMNLTYSITGVDPKSMGIEVDDKAGIISMMRHAATARNLQTLFDNFDESQRQTGDIMIEMIQHFWTYGKVKQVIGEEPTPEFDNKAFFKYGAKVVQGLLTETQEQLELAQIMQLQQMYPQIDLMEEVIDTMQIQNKERIKQKVFTQSQAQQQQQQQMTQLQMQQMQVDNETKLSYAHGQKALGEERLNKVKLDAALNVERLKKAQEDETASILNLVKAFKEIQSLDLTQIEQGLKILNQLRPEETVNEKIIDEQVQNY